MITSVFLWTFLCSATEAVKKTKRLTTLKDPATWPTGTEPATTRIHASQPPRSHRWRRHSAKRRGARHGPRVSAVTCYLRAFPDRRRVRRIDDWRRYGMNGVATRAFKPGDARARDFRVNTPEMLSAGGSEARPALLTQFRGGSRIIPGCLGQARGYRYG